MTKSRFKRSTLSPGHAQVLKGLVIMENSPGTILKDFEMFLGYIREGDLAVSGTRRLPLKVLPEINARLALPIEIRLMRPQQKSFPHIQGLHLLARASGLSRIGGTVKKPVLFVDNEIYAKWTELNPTERYFTLLETWLLRGKPEIVGEHGRGSFLTDDNFRQWMNFFGWIPKKGLQVSGSRDVGSSLRYIPGWHNLALMEMFGLVVIRHGQPREGEGWQIDRIDRTVFGEVLLLLLYNGFFGANETIRLLAQEEKVPIGALQPSLRPYFPEWKNNLIIPEWVFREGTCIFKVSLGRVRFVIAIPGSWTLGSMASVILDTVNFDEDHLYLFEYETPFGFLERVNHPYVEEGPWVDEVRIGDLPLRIGQTMTFLFDFGDKWEFNVTLERVDPDDAAKKPVVLEMHGEPPEQYPIWND